MEKLKLTEIQKFILLNDAYDSIVSQGHSFYHFIHPYDCDKITFNSGFFSKKNGARVEIVYSIDSCTVRLLYHYAPVMNFGIAKDFVFIPKAIAIEREFKSSILISIVPDPDSSRYIYQSLKSIQELCEGDSVGVDAGVEPAGVCLVAEDVKTPAL